VTRAVRSTRRPGVVAISFAIAVRPEIVVPFDHSTASLVSSAAAAFQSFADDAALRRWSTSFKHADTFRTHMRYARRSATSRDAS
jgi:hypothetical protein